MNLWNPYSEELRRLVLKSEGHESVESFIRAVGGDREYVMPDEPCGYHGLGYDPIVEKLKKSPSMPVVFSETRGNDGESKLRSSAKIRRLLSVEPKKRRDRSSQHDVHTQEMETQPPSTNDMSASESDSEDLNLRWRKQRA
mmetsp:Transcript_24066/g.37493  ORF Transcript_24066/g.37493 Transcript_24066/m.37493 type:complete len:141 (-) Transcript_24066:67-489(-)